MPDLEPLIGLLMGDPILAYSLLAGLFLAVVSLTAGLARLDVWTLAQPRAALACTLAVALAVLLRFLVYGDLLPVPDHAIPPLAGVERFPLVLAALAYGPTPGLAVAVLYSSFGWHDTHSVRQGAVLGLELVLAGWLAIYPSPREHRWAGPLNALIAYALAWATAGLALAQWQSGNLPAANLLESHAGEWLGVSASALLLLLVTPRAYRRLFPHSRIWETVQDGAGGDGRVVIEPLTHGRRPRSRDLPPPALPGITKRRRRRRDSGPR